MFLQEIASCRLGYDFIFLYYKYFAQDDNLTLDQVVNESKEDFFQNTLFDLENRTPLFYATTKDVVDTLIQYGDDPYRVTRDHVTSADFHALQGRNDLSDHLIKTYGVLFTLDSHFDKSKDYSKFQV